MRRVLKIFLIWCRRVENAEAWGMGKLKGFLGKCHEFGHLGLTRSAQMVKCRTCTGGPRYLFPPRDPGTGSLSLPTLCTGNPATLPWPALVLGGCGHESAQWTADGDIRDRGQEDQADPGDSRTQGFQPRRHEGKPKRRVRPSLDGRGHLHAHIRGFERQAVWRLGKRLGVRHCGQRRHPGSHERGVRQCGPFSPATSHINSVTGPRRRSTRPIASTQAPPQ